MGRDEREGRSGGTGGVQSTPARRARCEIGRDGNKHLALSMENKSKGRVVLESAAAFQFREPRVSYHINCGPKNIDVEIEKGCPANINVEIEVL